MQMRIELKNVKHAAFASEETDCFEASVYINGTRSGTVRNAGHGGPNEYTPWSLEEALNAYGKTLPPMVTEYDDPMDPTRKMELIYNADLLIGDAFERWHKRSHLTKLLRDRIVFVDNLGRLMETKRMSKEQIQAVIANPSLLRSPGRILNGMHEDAAFELYMAHI
jgi:hypothetical protein